MEEGRRHVLHVQGRWYDLIASGRKRHEGRLADVTVAGVRAGDVLCFQSESRPPLDCRVVRSDRYADFEAMLAGDRLGLLLPGVGTMAEGLEIYRSFPRYRELERQLGCLVFTLDLVERGPSDGQG